MSRYSSTLRQVLLTLLLCCAVSLSAQELLLPDTCHGQVGQLVLIKAKLTRPASSVNTTQRLQAQVLLSNPTVFLPESLQLGENTALHIQRQNDSSYFIDAMIPPGDSVSLVIIGSALAGNDPQCRLSLHNLRLDSISLASASTVILLDSSFAPGGYVRFGTLSEAFAQPSIDASILTWELRLDVASDVEYTILDDVGRALQRYEVYAGIGTTRISFKPDTRFYPGTYFLHLRCSSADLSRKFVIVR